MFIISTIIEAKLERIIRNVINLTHFAIAIVFLSTRTKFQRWFRARASTISVSTSISAQVSNFDSLDRRPPISIDSHPTEKYRDQWSKQGRSFQIHSNFHVSEPLWRCTSEISFLRALARSRGDPSEVESIIAGTRDLRLAKGLESGGRRWDQRNRRGICRNARSLVPRPALASCSSAIFRLRIRPSRRHWRPLKAHKTQSSP